MEVILTPPLSSREKEITVEMLIYSVIMNGVRI